ncbi:LysR family transcriptional regulator [Buttiauxella noackiae ATCC 51607]|uniref:LysR family transcriptional regulator n=1 Tax=Buttiauxella noackiae ATCC 51607 TaxID=1354255 RepID=A0A1B7HST0_9ENTR|nr:LysR family transcriptional regulator [Buttiauxella noackiae]OAT18696.1 LysR family transcriptional regulator [Buttiauxella noackiae ATCC 51607]
MNTRQLQHFIALMENISLSAAAETVHLSQPALSRSIKALEEQLNVPLFIRSDRRLRPTPYAQAWEATARRMLMNEKEGNRLLQMMQSGETGRVALGMGSSLIDELLGPLIETMLKTLPEVQVKVSVETSGPLLNLLRDRQIDFFVGDTSIARHQQDLAVEALFTCGFAWYASRQHPIALHKNIDIAQLKCWPMVIASGYFDPAVVEHMEELYGLSSGLYDNFDVQSNDFQIVKYLLSSSNAILAATDISMINDVEAGKVVKLHVTPPLSLTLTLGILRLTDRVLPPVTERVMTLIRDRLKQTEIRRIQL